MRTRISDAVLHAAGGAILVAVLLVALAYGSTWPLPHMPGGVSVHR